MLKIMRDLVAPDAAEDEDGGSHTQFTQENPLLQHPHTDIIRLGREMLRHLSQTVTIGIGLYDDHHFCRSNVGANCL